MEQNSLDPVDNPAPLVVEPLYQAKEAASDPPPRPQEVPAPLPETKPKGKRKKLPIILSVIAGILVVTLVAGLCTNWFGFYGPATKLILAAKKTLDANSFTMDTVLTVGKYTREYTITVTFDPNGRTLTALALDDDGDAAFAIYQGYYIKGRKATDISSTLDAIYDLLDDIPDKDKTWEERIRAISQELYDALDGLVNYDRINKCLIKLFRRLNSNQWLEENMGFSKHKNDDTTTYCFDPNTYRLANAAVECFQDAFSDPDAYNQITDKLKEQKSTLTGLDYEVSLGVKEKYLNLLELKMNTRTTEMALKFRFHDYGATTIDFSKLQPMVDKAL